MTRVRSLLASTVVVLLSSIAGSAMVPSRMLLSGSMKSSMAALYDAPLLPLIFDMDSVSEASTSTTIGNALKEYSPGLVFVVRRPG